jgi:hypothetical protein
LPFFKLLFSLAQDTRMIMHDFRWSLLTEKAEIKTV